MLRKLFKFMGKQRVSYTMTVFWVVLALAAHQVYFFLHYSNTINACYTLIKDQSPDQYNQ